MSAVMVLGASGLVGQHVVRHLVALGRPVIAVSRNPPDGALTGVDWVQCDVTEFESLAKLPRCAMVISTLAIWLTADIAPQLADVGVKRMVAFSSTSALTKIDASSATERQLAANLLDGEERLLSVNEIRSTLLRPTMIYGGVGDANVERIANQLRRIPIFPLVGNGQGLRQPVHAQDLGQAAVAALLTPSTEGRTYVLAGGEVLTVREMIFRIGEADDIRARFINLPLRPMNLFLTALGRIPKFRAIPPGALHRMTKDLTFDNAPAQLAFGYSPRHFDPFFMME